jgi:ParB-like chromosome segregation protein Spo0J
MTDTVSIGALRPHPDNPRRGNIKVIADSLRVNGQYKPIIVHQQTNHILAGNHTWRAAKKLGWATIDVTYVNCGEAEAKQILLADNRASDSGYTDPLAAFELLSTLPDLDGTGYTPADLELPEPEIGGWQPPDDDAREQTDTGPTRDDTGPQSATQPFRIGKVQGKLDATEYERWRANLPRSNRAAGDQILEWLGLTTQTEPAAQPQGISGSSIALIADLEPYPGNPRQGDIGMLSGLLMAHGQYREIVVNSRNKRILAGNHVAEAARQLGWTTIKVAWVDADDDREKRIVLADNRTADLATYDMEALGRAIAGMGPEGIAGTGFSLADLDDVLAGRDIKEAVRTGGVWIRIGKVSAKTTEAALAELGLTPGQELFEAAHMLSIDPGKISAR